MFERLALSGRCCLVEVTELLEAAASLTFHFALLHVGVLKRG